MPQKAIVEGTTFSIALRSFGKHEANHVLHETLFGLTVSLGGFGRRSRRGFGGVIIEQKNKAVYPREDDLLQWGMVSRMC